MPNSTVHPLIREMSRKIDKWNPRAWYSESRTLLRLIADYIQVEESPSSDIPTSLRAIASHRAEHITEHYTGKDNVGGNIARAEYDPEEKP